MWIRYIIVQIGRCMYYSVWKKLVLQARVSNLGSVRDHKLSKDQQQEEDTDINMCLCYMETSSNR